MAGNPHCRFLVKCIAVLVESNNVSEHDGMSSIMITEKYCSFSVSLQQKSTRYQRAQRLYDPNGRQREIDT